MSSAPDSTPDTLAARANAADAPPQAPRDVRGPLSRRRKWLFRMAAMSLVFVLLGMVELILRLAGVGQDLSSLVKPAGDQRDQPSPRAYRMNPEIDRVYYGPADLFGPEDRPFLLPKPEETCRVVVVGASTVAGFPYLQELAFPRFIEIALRRQAPGRTIEVLNAGIVAINTFGEADLVQRALACSPDLIIVYTGQNEFVGPGGVGSKFGGASSQWTPALFALRRTRVHQLALRTLVPGDASTQQLVSRLLGDLAIAHDSPKFHKAEEEFRSNLERMVRITTAAHVPLMLTTPIVNLRGHSPVTSLHREGLSSRKLADWRAAFDEGESFLRKRSYAEALEAFDRAEAIDDGYALVSFRRGQVLEGLERWADAKEAYRKACDLDACRFRAPGSFGRIAQDVARAAASPDVHFVDTAAEFERGAPHGIPGEESLLEHVHFTYEGNWRLALILAEKIAQDLLKTTWRSDSVPAPPERDELCGAILQDHLIAETLTLMLLQKEPIVSAPGAPEQVEAMKAAMRRLFEALPPREREIFAQLSTETLQFDIIGSLVAAYAGAGLDEECGPLLRRGVVRQPWNITLRTSLAEWEARHGNTREALRVLDETKDWWPNAARASKLRSDLTGGQDAESPAR